MFFRSDVQFHICCAIAFVFAFAIPADQTQAQRSDRSLFVIKSPDVEHSLYGEKPSAIKFASIAQQQESTPREDVLADEATQELDELSSSDDAENDLLIGDEDDDEFGSNPPVAQMTTWNLKPMSSITPGMRPVNGKSPADQSWQLTNRNSMPIVNSDKLFAWAAPDITYNPLYFEDVALERYGQTRGFLKQPFVSGFRFLKSTAFLPYYSLYDPINSCDGPLGYCRPGECVNCVENKHYFGNPFNGKHR